MTNMKVLIYGSKGWIGNQFCELMNKNNIKYVCGTERADDENKLREEIIKHNPTNIVSFIGRTHGKIGDKEYTTIDYLEQEGKLVENMKDNLYAPITIAMLAKKLKIHYTYLGTGCIFKFDNDINKPFSEEINGFTESEKPNFFGSGYSIVKGFTDRLMHQLNDDVLNLRIRMPIVDEPNTRNFVTKILKYDKICSVPNSMTVLPELLPYVLKMMSDKVTGTVNLTNPGLISHNEILEMYKDIVDPSYTWNNFSQEEQRQILAADRSNNYLDTTLLESMFPEIDNIKVAVKKCILKYKNHVDVSETNNLLVTGGCGFIGSNFINHYFSKVDKIINVDAMHYCAHKGNIDKKICEHPNYILVEGNICDGPLMKSTLEKYKITHVVHFAAQSHVQNSFDNSINFTHDNIAGTHTLLDECRKYGSIKKFVHVSTDEVYGETLGGKCDELSILAPTNPYAATKAGAELIAQSYHHTYKMPIIITRGNNVYGPNQYPEKLIPLCILRLKNNKPITIQGDGSCVRAFLHSHDTARAFATILEKGKIGEIYNIGCDENMEYSVMDVSKILINKIHNTTDYDKWIKYIPDRLYNDKRYYISNQKLKDIGWDVKINFEDGINQLIKSFDEDDYIKRYDDIELL